jgi:hypothetical protein
MKVQIDLNPKKESDQIAAFLSMINGWDHTISLVYGPDDLLDQEAGVTLENLPVSNYHMMMANRVVFVDGVETKELYRRAEVNKPIVIQRKKIKKERKDED